MPFLPRLALSVLLLLTVGFGAAGLALAGGITVGPQVSHYLDGALNSGWQAGANTPASVNPPGQPPVTVGGGLIGRGVSAVSTWFGDPVNLVTGNVYHAERDLAIPGRGLPLVFERSYNSRLPQGWKTKVSRVAGRPGCFPCPPEGPGPGGSPKGAGFIASVGDLQGIPNRP